MDTSAVNEKALKPDKADPHCPDATSSTPRIYTQAHTQTQTHEKPASKQMPAKGLEINESLGH